MKFSGTIFDTSSGNDKDIIDTDITFKYTFFRNFLDDNPIIPLSIYNLAAKQHCDMNIATINTVSGMQKFLKSINEIGRINIFSHPTTLR